MGIVKKTKEERKADSAKVYQTRPDTPLGETPDPTAPITNLKTALADINTRTAVRQASIDASHAKLDAARIARSKEKRSIAGDGGRLYGLASFAGTTGRQTKETKET
jgi:leucyl-tRNA synthetase